jgi:MFS transporter, DHA2 family, multidrug resistance protein
VLGSIAATRYDTRIDAIHVPAQLAGTAKQSIGVATQIAHPLPARSPSACLASTRSRFTGGITMATVIGAAIVVVAAALVALFLPAHPKGPSS